MSIPKPLFLFCLILSLSMASMASAQDPHENSAYVILEKFGFPKGILPEGVQSYALREDGRFEVVFDKDCKFNVEGGYSLSYRRKITGKLSLGSLKELQGVSVKVMFVWLSISEVSTGDGQLYFYVGPLSASFPLCNFDESPRCGCGFDCVSKLVSDV